MFSWSKTISANNCKNWMFKIEKFMEVNNLSNITDGDMSNKCAIELCKPVCHSLDVSKWSENLWNDRKNVNGNKLRTYRLFTTQLAPGRYLNYNMPRYKRAAFTKLTCGVLPLEIETSRNSNVKYDENYANYVTKEK